MTTKTVGRKRGAKPLDEQVWIERMATKRKCCICGKPYSPKNRKGYWKWLKTRTCGLECRKKLSFQL